MSKCQYEDLGDCDDNYVSELHSSYQVPEEFQDYLQVMEMGARKHGADNWLNPNGSKSSFKQMHSSMFRHLAESSAGKTEDHESGLHPLLHLICRAQMLYTRITRGIKHDEDV